jgi:hypothetical protein
MQLGPIWSNQQIIKHTSFSKWWICYEDCFVFSSSIILKWHHHHALASNCLRGYSFWKHVCFLRMMIEAHVFAKKCLLGVTVCALYIETFLISFVTHHWTSCLVKVNVCNREHLSLLVLTSSFKMDAGDGRLGMANVMCIWI